jgi:hypothetical protein
MNNFCKNIFSKFIIFRVKSIFESNVFKWVIKKKFLCSNLFALLIINVKILFNFQNEWCTFDKKFMTIQIIMFDLWFFKYIKIQFKKMSIHLNGSFNCVYTFLTLLFYSCFNDVTKHEGFYPITNVDFAFVLAWI